MAKRSNLTENYVAQCAHGGILQPKGTSSTPNVTVAGVPIVNIQDLPGTPISGCKNTKNPCTVVANLTTGSAEMNVQSGGVNPALDLVGIKSNKGAAISLSYPGQTTSGAESLKEGDSSVESEEASTKDQVEAKEIKTKEKYNLYLIRESKDAFLEKTYKPIRASRAFNRMEEYYSFDIGSSDTTLSEKIITYTLAFVYIKLASGQIDEYKVTNAGSVLGEKLKDIRYVDEKNNKHKYIPLYDGEGLNIYYTNVQLRKSQALRKTDLSNFKSISFNPSSPKNNDFYIKNLDSINQNEISQELLDEQKRYDPIKSNIPYPFDIIVNIKDPIAQVEDLYNSFEFKYKNNYSYNNYHIQNIKKKNAYVFTVANQMDYLYVSNEDQKIYDTHIDKLQTLYKKLAKALLNGRLSSLVIKDLENIEALDTIIDPSFNIAVNYFNEVSSIKKTFFKDMDLDNCSKKYFEIKSGFVITKYYGLVDYEHVNSENSVKLKRLLNGFDFTDNINSLYLVLSDASKVEYYPYRKKPYEMLALLIFSIYFSNRYTAEIEKAGLKQTVEDFYFAVKNAPKLPQISEKSIDEVRTVVVNQKESYSSILSGENKLLEQYKNLDNFNKEYSYDTKSAEKINPKSKLNDLYVDKEYKSFVYEKSKVNAKDIFEFIQKSINKSEIKEQIQANLNIKEFDSQEIEKNYFNTMINLIYFFISNKTKTDSEANMNSPFRVDKLHIYNLLKDITQRRLKLEGEFAHKIIELPVNEYYTKTILSHILHSLVQTNKNSVGFTLRSQKANELLNDLKTTKNRKYKLDVSDLLDTSYEAGFESKKKIDELQDGFLVLAGLTSKVAAIILEVSKEGAGFDTDASDVGLSDKRTSNLKKYQILSKSLASLVTIVNIGSYTLGKKVLKNEDIFPLVESTGKFVGFISSAMPKTKAAIIEASQNILSDSNIQSLKNFDVLAKVGIVTILVSTYYEVTKLDKTDTDGQTAVLMKNSLELSLLLMPLCVAIPGLGVASAVVALGIHLAWEFYLKDVFVDSKVETYVLKSLLFNHKQQPKMFETLSIVSPLGYALYSKVSSLFDDDINYNTMYLKEIMNKDKENVKGFATYKELQTFIGANYTNHEDEFNEALKHELTNLKVSLNGFTVEIEDTKDKIENIKDRVILQTQIKIPKETLLNNIQVILKTNTFAQSIYKSKILENNEMPKIGKDFIYDTVKSTNLQQFLSIFINKKHFENVYLYVVNRDITLKYKIEYNINLIKPELDPESMMFTDYMKDEIVVKIKEIELSPLQKSDKTMIDKVRAERKKEEGIK